MIEGRLASAVLTSCAVTTLAVAACSIGGGAPPPTLATDAAPITCRVVEDPMAPDEMTIRETTQPTISGQLVGVSNIWERELPDDTGVIAPRLSAMLTIHELASKHTRKELVFAGSVLSLGSDRYCVANVEEGESMPGTITLRKIAPGQAHLSH